MITARKNTLKYGSSAILLMAFVLLTSFIGNVITPSYNFDDLLTNPKAFSYAFKRIDTLPGKSDTSFSKSDTFQVKMSKDSIDAPVQYEASDSMAFDVPNKRIILYSKGKVLYKDIDLSADSIGLDQSNSMLVATFRTDTSGAIIGKPVMIQADTKMQSDVIRYNFKTQKGITQNTFTEQGEMHVNLQLSKKINTTDFYGLQGRLTTCNLDTPHFAFRTNKMKLVNKKFAVTGPVHPEFEGVPVPIYIPFGFFPLSQGRHSGLLPPQFNASEQFGLGLEGLGYYKVLNEYFDVTMRSNLYSYGGWNLYLTPTYRKRYRYNGTLNFSLQKTRILTNSALSEFQNSNTFNITWSHTVDSRARPGTNFSANVNAGSTKFNQYLANNSTRNFTNQMNSSITYSKTWGSLMNLSMSATHNQNNNTGLVNLSLPNLSYTLNTLYPFQKKEFVGEPKWYEKLGIGLSSNVANQISFFDSAFSMHQLIDTMQWGAQHNIPIQLSLPPLGPLQVSPGITFQEKWYSRKFIRQWNPNAKKVDTVINKGFYAARDLSFSIGMNTAIFGMFDKFGKNSPVKALRHVIRPNLSVSYKPDMAGRDHYNTQIDTSGRSYRFSYYDGTMFGAFGEGKFGGLSFGVDNNLEAKIRSKKDTTDGGIKKVKLIDGFGFNGSYNFMADSFQLSTISLYARSTLFDKINITAGAVMDPYQTDAKGFRKNTYAWAGGKFSPGHVVNGNIAISTSFQSKSKEDGKNKKEPENDPNAMPITMQEQQMQLEYARQNPAEFVDFNVPWNMSLAYSLNFYRQFRRDYSGFTTEISSNLNVNGDFSLTPKWKLGMTAFYDFKTSKLQSVTSFISREMHCWQLSINVTPIGLYRSFNISINPKSGILRDLKLNRTRFFYGN